MKPGDAELLAKWLNDFETKAKRMADDSFGVAGVGRELEVIAALRRQAAEIERLRADLAAKDARIAD